MRSYLGVLGWSAWLMFAEAAKECGADLTRKCAWDNILKIKNWTGGGLHAPQDSAANTIGDCFNLLQATPSGFKSVDIGANNGIYSCDPKNVYRIPNPVGKGVKLSDVGRSIADLK